jgi:hypothetical protein
VLKWAKKIKIFLKRIENRKMKNLHFTGRRIEAYEFLTPMVKLYPLPTPTSGTGKVTPMVPTH